MQEEQLIEELVYGYFSFEKDHHPDYKRLLDQFYQSPGAVKIENKNHRIKTSVGHLDYGKKNQMELVYYGADKSLTRNSDQFCLLPFYFIPSCNYMFYGFYLSVCAYLINAPLNTKLTLYLPAMDNDKVSFIYRPEIAEAFLIQRSQSIGKIENGSVKTLKQTELSI